MLATRSMQKYNEGLPPGLERERERERDQRERDQRVRDQRDQRDQRDREQEGARERETRGSWLCVSLMSAEMCGCGFSLRNASATGMSGWQQECGYDSDHKQTLTEEALHTQCQIIIKI